MSEMRKTGNLLMNAELSGVKNETTDSDELEDLSAQLPPWPRVDASRDTEIKPRIYEKEDSKSYSYTT
jgi:hypothetical protein